MNQQPPSGQPPYGQPQSRKSHRLSKGERIALITAGSTVLVTIIIYILAPVIVARVSSSVTPTASPTLVPTSSAPTPSPTPVQTIVPSFPQAEYLQVTSGTPSFSDSLSAQDSHEWDVYSNTSFGCGFENDRAYHAFTFHPNVDAECLAKATNFSNNFVYQVQMTTTKGEGGGIIFGSEAGTSIKYRFFVNTGTYCDLFVPLNNQRLFDGSDAPITSGLNHPNLIAVMVLSNTIYLFVNKKYIGMAKTLDGSPLFGQIGLFAVEIGKPTDVVFSELNVWQI